MELIFFAFFASVFCELILEINSGIVYCNSSTHLSPYAYIGEFCTEKLQLENNNTIVLIVPNGEVIRPNVSRIISVETVENTSVAGIAETYDSSYAFFFNYSIAVSLSDLNRSVFGKSAWNPLQQQYWSLGYPDVGTQPKFYLVDVENNFTTSFYVIPTGEKPVDIYWNGTEIIGIVERNFTYYTVAFQLNNRRTVLGPVNNTIIVKDRIQNRVYLRSISTEWQYLCERSCPPEPPTPTPTYPEIPSTHQQSSRLQTMQSTTPSEFYRVTSHSRRNLEIVTLVSTVQFTLNSGFVNIPGRLVIQDGTTLVLDLSGQDLATGDTLTLYTFSELQGSFSNLEIVTTSCLSYTADLEYDSNSISFVITSYDELCTAGSCTIQKAGDLNK